jgi:phage tail-like protein
MSRQQGWLVRRLPVGMQEDRVMVGLLSILEEVAESVQQHADQIPHLADPSVTPEPLLSWLGRFVDAPDTENLPVTERRDLLARAGSLILRKGTKKHLQTLVAPYVSGSLEVVDDGGIYREGQAPRAEGRVVVRAGSITHGTPSDLLKLIRSITPSHCLVSLEVDGVRFSPEER